MKHIRTYEKYRIIKNRTEIIKESVLQVNDIYKVKTMIDIPQSLINSYVKKVKETTGKNLRQFFGDVDIAEEIVKYINMNNLDIEKIPGGALMGGQEQTQVQPQVQPQAQMQTQPDQTQPDQTQPDQAQPDQAQPDQAQPDQTQTQPDQTQPENDEFEEPQGQQTQTQTQAQVQPTEDENEEELPL